MADDRSPRVLVPVAVLRDEELSPAIVDVFASVKIVLCGYHVVPDQTGLEQARDQFEERAWKRLDRHRQALEAAGATVEPRFVLTHDRLTTFERIAVEESCAAILMLAETPTIERVLVAVRGDVAIDPIATLIAAVLADTDCSVTLFSVLADGERTNREALLDDLADRLEAGGVPPDRIRQEIVVDDSPTDAIVEASADHDLIVAGESRPSIRRLIFRDRTKRIARRSADPVLVVRGHSLEADDSAEESSSDELDDSADGSTETSFGEFVESEPTDTASGSGAFER